ncbi:hypothetical protein BD309DRAFT_621258 [Dichomitus squalens]|nr:hypothetical protein BD309DRAFT_621258 [Dichomitus squalens]
MICMSGRLRRTLLAAFSRSSSPCPIEISHRSPISDCRPPPCPYIVCSPTSRRRSDLRDRFRLSERAWPPREAVLTAYSIGHIHLTSSLRAPPAHPAFDRDLAITLRLLRHHLVPILLSLPSHCSLLLIPDISSSSVLHLHTRLTPGTSSILSPLHPYQQALHRACSL